MQNVFQRLSASAVFAVVCAAGMSAHGASVTYEFGAIVQTVEGTSQSQIDLLATYGIVAGATVTGSYIIDTSAPGSPGGPLGTRYGNAVTRFEIRMGSFVAILGEGGDPSGSNFLDVDDNGNRGDLWQVSAFIDTGLPGFGTSIWELTLGDETGNALDSVASDQTLPGLDVFGPFISGNPIGTGVDGVFVLPGGIGVVESAFDFHRRVVPLPAAGWLMFCALGALGLRARRRKR